MHVATLRMEQHYEVCARTAMHELSGKARWLAEATAEVYIWISFPSGARARMPDVHVAWGGLNARTERGLLSENVLDLKGVVCTI